uniref:RING-type domain-containing protein n=1 Tax=Angiostrongylus cantonensis TaxID=6313 RepID=A0A0K0DHR2_ANGCA
MSVGRGRCVICTSMFFSHDIAALHCGHTFHYVCISKWVQRSKTCPICRIRTAEKQIIQHLYFDSADELGVTQLGHADAAQIEALYVALEKEKSTALEAQEEVLKLRDSVASLQAKAQSLSNKLDSEKKRVLEKISSLEARNDQLEMIYKFITTGKDDSALDKYVADSGGVDVGQFLNILRKQLNEARKLQERLTNDLRIERELVRALKKKECKLKNIVKVLHQELKDVRIASHMDASAPFNPRLSSLVLEQSPPKRSSLGFNESLEFDANVLCSALRTRSNGEPVLKKISSKTVCQPLLFNSSDDENDFDLLGADSSFQHPVLDSISNPEVPKSMRERVLKNSENSLSTGLGGAQRPADMALADLELRILGSLQCLPIPIPCNAYYLTILRLYLGLA